MAKSQLPIDDLKPAVVRPAFAGFFFRMLAFFIDCVAIYFIFYVLDRVARPALLALNPALPYLGHVLIFIYFLIGYGPLTKGQTLGKALLSLQVAGRDGLPLAWPAAARRALLQQFVFLSIFFFFNLPILSLFDNTTTYLFVFPFSWWYGAKIATLALGILGFTQLVITALSAAFHPYKQSLHDIWAGSFVTPSPTPYLFTQAMQVEPDIVAQRRIANHVKIFLIFWLVLSALLLFNLLKYSFSAEVSKVMTEKGRISSAYSQPPYLLSDTAFPDPALARFINRGIEYEREQARQKGETVPTTASLRARMPLEEDSIYAAYFRRTGAYQSADLADPQLREKMELLRRELWRQWMQTADGKASLTSGTLQARSFTALLFEPLTMVMYNDREAKGRVRGPANPALGKLIYEDVPAPDTQAAAPLTSGTATTTGGPAHATPKP